MDSVKILLFLLVSIANPATLRSHNVISISKLTNDIIENERVPSLLYAKTCWSKDDDIYFVKNIPFPIQIVNSVEPINLLNDESIKSQWQWFFIDMNCVKYATFLSSVDEKYFAHPYRWIFIDAANDSIEHLNFLPGSNIILANRIENSEEFVLNQVYKIGKSDVFIHEYFGNWSFQQGLNDSRATRILSQRRRNLKGHRLIAPTVFIQEGSENHTDLDDYRHKTIDSISKLSLLITQHWIDSINATMTGDVHRTWGYKNKKTGRISGMAGQLERGEADIGGTIVFMTIDRLAYLDYLSMSVPSSLKFILRAPPISYVSNIYYLPFNGIVWLCSISLVILCTSLIAVTLKLHWAHDVEAARNLNLTDYLLFAISSSCQMGSEIISKILSARISMFVFFVALLFIYTSFTANIVALLQSTTKSIRSVSDLQNPAIGIGVHDNPFNRYYFSIQSEPARKSLYETRVVPSNGPEAFMNLTYGISRMRQGMFAFHAATGQAYDEIEQTFFENEKCGLVEIPYLGLGDTWSVCQKKSPYREILKVNIMKIREHGIQAREKTRIYKKRPTCNSDGKNFGSVRLIDCHAAMYILLYGYMASLLIFCLEKFINSKLNAICAHVQTNSE